MVGRENGGGRAGKGREKKGVDVIRGDRGV